MIKYYGWVWYYNPTGYLASLADTIFFFKIIKWKNACIIEKLWDSIYQQEINTLCFIHYWDNSLTTWVINYGSMAHNHDLIHKQVIQNLYLNESDSWFKPVKLSVTYPSAFLLGFCKRNSVGYHLWGHPLVPRHGAEVWFHGNSAESALKVCWWHGLKA